MRALWVLGLLGVVAVSTVATAGFQVENVIYASYPYDEYPFLAANMDGDPELEVFVPSYQESEYVYIIPGIVHLATGVREPIAGIPPGTTYSGGTARGVLADVDGDGSAEAIIVNAVLGSFAGMLVIGWDGNPPAGVASPDEPGRDLARVAPNPSPGSCAVSFSVPQPGPVSAVLFDVSGRRVREILSGTLPAGSYSPTWDGRDDAGHDVAAGVYLLKVTTPAGESSGRVVLAR